MNDDTMWPVHRNASLFLLMVCCLMLTCGCLNTEWCVRMRVGRTIGEGQFARERFSGGLAGPVEAVHVGDYDPSPGLEVAVMGDGHTDMPERAGFLVSLATRQVVRKLPRGGTRPKILQTADGSFSGILQQSNPTPLCDVWFVEESGRRQWTYPPPRGPEVYFIDGGDIDGDGKLEFFSVPRYHEELRYVRTVDGVRKYERIKGDRTVHWLDSQGKLVRRMASANHRYPRPLFVQACPQRPGRPGGLIALFSDPNGGSCFQLYGSEGQFASQMRTREKIGQFLARRSQQGIGPVVGVNTSYGISYIGIDGVTRWRRVLEGSEARIRFAFVRFDRDAEPYVCVLTDLKHYLPWSVLYIFRSDGELVYRRLVGTTYGLSACPLGDGVEGLLASDFSEVWLYRLRPSTG